LLFMENKNLTINIATGTVLKIVGIILFLAFIYFIRDIILIVLISVIFAIILEPLIDALESWSVSIIKRKIPRALLILFVYLILFIFLIIVARLIIPPIAEQVGILTKNFPELWTKIVENFNSLRQYSEEKGLMDNIQGGLKSLQSGLETAAGGVYSLIRSLFQSIVNFFLILIIVFYLVIEKDAINKLFKVIAPVQYHNYLINLFHDIQKKITAWAAGQLILGLLVGLLSFVGLIILLPRYALVLALVAAITEFIPYLGPVLGAIPAVFLGFTVPSFSLSRGIIILLFYVVVQQVEEKFLVPKVMQKKVGLNPVVIIIVMLIGFRLAGIIGLILAIPVSTAIGVIIQDFVKKSELPKIKARLDQESNDVV